MTSENTNTPKRHNHFKMLTKKEFQDMAVARISAFSIEFSDGFKFLENYTKSVTIFGGSHFTEENNYYKKAESLARRIVTELNYCVFTGGGPGIMEAANKGAFEAGGKSLGLTIELLNHQVQNKYLTDNLNFHYFFSRRVCLAFSAEAYVFYPGGFGTMDEFFEIVTLVQTGKIEKVPVILVGSDFWNPFHEIMKNEMLSRGTIETQDLDLYTITDNEDEIIEIIRKAPIRDDIRSEK